MKNINCIIEHVDRYTHSVNRIKFPLRGTVLLHRNHEWDLQTLQGVQTIRRLPHNLWHRLRYYEQNNGTRLVRSQYLKRCYV